MELSGFDTFTAIADKFGNSIRTTRDAEYFFDEFMKMTQGSVIVDFLDCDNDDRIEGYSFDHEAGFVKLYTRLPEQNTVERMIRKAVLPFDNYSILVRLKNIDFVRVKDNKCLAIVVNGYTMHRKMVEKYVKKNGYIIVNTNDKDSFFTIDIAMTKNNETEYLRAMATPITSFWIIPKKLHINPQDSEEYLYYYNIEVLSNRIDRVWNNLNVFINNTDDIEEKEDFLKMCGNQLRCIAEGLFKLITCYYFEKYNFQNGDKAYNDRLLGDIIGPLKKSVYSSQEDQEYLSHIVQIANKLSHESGLPTNVSEVEELKKIIFNYLKDFKKKVENRDNYQEPMLSHKPFPDKYVEENLGNWDFSKEISTIISGKASNCSFRMKINHPFHTYSFLNQGDNYLCKDGKVKHLNYNDLSEALIVTDRTEFVKLGNAIYAKIKELCDAQGLDAERTVADISSDLIKCGSPTHLFTLDEIKKLMYNADDTLNNKLVIDEKGYANIIQDRSLWNLYPVSIETWCADNGYVGKESSLSDAEPSYHLCLELWLDYLRTGKRQYADLYVYIEEKEIISQIMEYYK